MIRYMKEMSLIDHLEELRARLIRVVIILAVSFVLTYSIADKISEYLLMPLRSALGGEGSVVFLGLLDKVLSQFQIAFWSSIIISAPLWFYQVWAFIRPGLHDREVKVIRPFMFVAVFLFITGVCFGYFIVFPFTFETILGFGVGDVEATISLKEYLVLASKVLVFLGVLFQLPNVLLILGFMDIVTKQYLRSIRKYVYCGFAVMSAALTPPDVITMMALWIPLAALYEVGILAVAWIVHPYLKKKYPLSDD
jgi:sec-independent protein translocase protein TatC